MANKRYYWLKLYENFFNNDSILYLEELENGNDCIIFFLKLCLNTLNDEGFLLRKLGNNIAPHNEKSLARLTRTDIDTVKEVLSILIEAGLLEILEGDIIFIPMVKDMVGSETQSTIRSRKSREKQKALHCNTDIEIEKEKEKEKDKDIDIEKDKDKDKDIDKEIELLFPPSSFKADYRD